MTGNGEAELAPLDAAHADNRPVVALNHHRVRPQAAIRDDRRKIVEVDDVVDFDLSGNGSAQAAVSALSQSSTISSRSSASAGSRIYSSWNSDRLAAEARTSSPPVTTS